MVAQLVRPSQGNTKDSRNILEVLILSTRDNEVQQIPFCSWSLYFNKFRERFIITKILARELVKLYIVC